MQILNTLFQVNFILDLSTLTTWLLLLALINKLLFVFLPIWHFLVFPMQILNTWLQVNFILDLDALTTWLLLLALINKLFFVFFAYLTFSPIPKAD